MTARGLPNTHSRIPAPTARYGSLLEMIQLAHHLSTATPYSFSAKERKYCLVAAKLYRQTLEEADARGGLRSYVENCPAPWPGLWPQVEAVIKGTKNTKEKP